jgi:hypothetical protein
LAQRKFSRFVSIGLLALAAGILLRLFIHANYTEFVAGFLIGLGIVLLIFGFVKTAKLKSK